MIVLFKTLASVFYVVYDTICHINSICCQVDLLLHI